MPNLIEDLAKKVRNEKIRTGKNKELKINELKQTPFNYKLVNEDGTIDYNSELNNSTDVFGKTNEQRYLESNPLDLDVRFNQKYPNEKSTEITDKEKTFYEKGIEDTKREKLLGLLGYGIQGVSALRDLAENVNQDYSQPPNDVYNKRVEYKPVDIEPYLNKMKESEAGYLKYLKETGNGNLIPSLMSYGSQKNELAAKMTEANNQKEIAIAGANAQSDLQVMQLNQQLRSDYNKQKFAEMQYRDNAIRSNKSAIFGSIAGALSTGAGATTKELQLDLYKERLAAGDIEGARAIAYQLSNLEDPYVAKSKSQNNKK